LQRRAGPSAQAPAEFAEPNQAPPPKERAFGVVEGHYLMSQRAQGLNVEVMRLARREEGRLAGGRCAPGAYVLFMMVNRADDQKTHVCHRLLKPLHS
jgi:hypothetical protein